MGGKLIFHYGTVCSGKTLTLLNINFNYHKCGWHSCIIKPELDTRSELVETRANIPPCKADIILKETESLFNYSNLINEYDVILVDECQFMTPNQIDELRSISLNNKVDVLCFGLRTDSNTHLFEASKRLFELADEIIEIKTICGICGKHASFNKKLSGSTSSIIDVGWDKFMQTCWEHFND